MRGVVAALRRRPVAADDVVTRLGHSVVTERIVLVKHDCPRSERSHRRRMFADLAISARAADVDRAIALLAASEDRMRNDALESAHAASVFRRSAAGEEVSDRWHDTSTVDLSDDRA